MKGIIFDLDNTLIDFMKMKRLSCEEAISAMIDSGLDIEYEKAMEILYQLYDRYGLEHQKIFQEFLKETTGKIDFKILANGIVAYRRMKSGFLEPYPHVHSTLLKLKMKGIKLAIVSDAPKLQAWLRLAAMKLTDFFEVVVTFEDTGEKKPNSKPFEAALRQLNFAANEVLMVGDWPERDIHGAKELGMKTCFARYGYVKEKIPKTDADYEIDSIQELLKL